ncbi:MAG: bifunctional 4-hydroxy-2-oxoglutarate aldolase/2-dehydro-3-deoxy-phosphogluconate aldolase [Candidatus Lokiarchaeota archaeon]|jgi:2-dehydro-3-deoxyphosphogluconate aldolase/(4S)-4-hydroxy-2-oxoglutarate aldolase
MDIFEKIKDFKIIPVATIEKLEDAVPLGKTLLEAGLPVIEVTFRTGVAAKSISLLSEKIPNLCVGAGTVLKIEQVKQAVNAGAQFIVTPGFNPKVVDYCVKNHIPIIPGLNTPTMVEWALERGIEVVKFFPADLSGGPRMLKNLAGPYPTMKFMPTGGINNDSLKSYLDLPNVIACGGSWIVRKDLVAEGKFEEIKNLIKNALFLIK